jgi:hypothetical protein
MPLQATSGAASYDAFGGGAAAVPNYIEDVFSTWLYAGTGAIQTITNGIDLAGEGGLVWIKQRNSAVNHRLFDTNRGSQRALETNTTSGGLFSAGFLRVFNSDGFEMGSGPTVNESGDTYASWTFRKQPKFFDVVTYTGDGSDTRTLTHSLGTSSIGTIIFKRTDATSDWIVWHKSLSAGNILILNNTIQAQSNISGTSQVFNTTATTFDVDNVVFGTSGSQLNRTAVTYVAYLFAHDAGGFGLTGTDNVISCGSYTGNGSATGPVVSLGYEPQWLMIKRASGGTGNWNIIDSMRGMAVGGTDAFLEANTADAEATADWVSPTATGFQITSTSSEVNTSSSTYIYIAIRRGPMRTPTTGTSVFAPVVFTGALNSALISTGFPVDLSIGRLRSSTDSTSVIDRLRSPRTTNIRYLFTNATAIEATNASYGVGFDSNVGFLNNWFTGSDVAWNFRRAPGFFDVVCYTGTGSATAVAHNLGVAPEFTIIKSRNSALDWRTKHIALPTNNCLLQSSSSAAFDACISASSNATFTPNSNSYISSITYVAYLFATCPGVSKVGSYTGTGTTQTINCGFTGGARFVLIKRTDSTGDWYVWDTARGIVAGNDPYLLLNSTAAEVTSTDYIDTASTGFEISSTAPAAINASGGSFIFLAVA